jgi:hypothetical protein
MKNLRISAKKNLKDKVMVPGGVFAAGPCSLSVYLVHVTKL